MSIDYFTDSEMTCPCCGKVIFDPCLHNLLNKTRAIYGRPMIIASGYRCAKHNAEVGGVPGSAHLTGEAADIQCWLAQDRHDLIRTFLTLGATRLGISKSFIHVDVSTTLPQMVIWLYGGDA